MADKTIN